MPAITNLANRELERLAGVAHQSDALHEVFERSAPEQISGALQRSEECRAFAARVEGFLARYGLRETVTLGAAFPAWRDDPSLPYGLLKGLVAAGPSPVAEAGSAAAAQELLEPIAARRRLGPGRLQLPLALGLTRLQRRMLVYRENSHAYLMMPVAVIRRLALELGRRLAACGALEGPEAIFLLYVEELQAALDPPVPQPRHPGA